MRFKHSARVRAITKDVKLVCQYRVHDLRANRLCWHGDFTDHSSHIFGRSILECSNNGRIGKMRTKHGDGNVGVGEIVSQEFGHADNGRFAAAVG